MGFDEQIAACEVRGHQHEVNPIARTLGLELSLLERPLDLFPGHVVKVREVPRDAFANQQERFGHGHDHTTWAMNWFTQTMMPRGAR